MQRIHGELVAHGALVGMSDHGSTKALYAKDLDGLEFEVSWLVPLRLMPTQQGEGGHQQVLIAPLDIAAAIATYGAQTMGGTAS